VLHTFQNAGEFEVVLSVTDNENATTTITKTIVVTEAPNQLPVADVSANPTSGDIPLDVTFDGSLSHDPDGTISEYVIDFGDGSPVETSSIPFITHRYLQAGDYTAAFKVKDNRGEFSEPVNVVIHVFEA